MIKIKDGNVYSTTGKLVMRKSTGACAGTHAALPGDTAAAFEEVDERPHYTEEQYNAKVSELIHSRYSADREVSLINNMLDAEPTDEHAAEYREYQVFRAQCKAQAREQLEAEWMVANAPDPDPEADGEDAEASEGDDDAVTTDTAE